jgi:four helix bundle protein
MEENKSKIKDFRDLDIWNLAMKIVIDIYKHTKTFPKEEIYGLANQMRRAVVSIASK